MSTSTPITDAQGARELSVPPETRNSMPPGPPGVSEGAQGSATMPALYRWTTGAMAAVVLVPLLLGIVATIALALAPVALVGLPFVYATLVGFPKLGMGTADHSVHVISLESTSATTSGHGPWYAVPV